MQKNKCAIYISVFSLFVMNLKPQLHLSIIDVIISAFIVLMIIKGDFYHKSDSNLIHNNAATAILSCVLSLIMGFRFYFSWTLSSKLLLICFGNVWVKNIVLAGITVLLMTGSFLIIDLLLNKLISLLPGEKKQEVILSNTLTIQELVIIFLTAAVCITICSKSSPLYPFNTWNDANELFTVGKAIAHHKVIYKDIFVQKGPLVYFLISFAYLISHTTFLGVYFLELIACFAFLLISYKTITLFTDTPLIYSVPVLGIMIYSSHALSQGGSAEEFILPVVALSNYYALKSLLSNEKITWKKCLVIGISSGAVFWTKYSLLGFYIGFGLVFTYFYIKRKWFKSLLQSVLILISGVLASSLPFLFYFGRNHAIKDLFVTYFYYNIKLYSNVSDGNKLHDLFMNILNGYSTFIQTYLLGFIMIAVGMLYLIRNKVTASVYFLVTFLLSLFFIYSGGQSHIYYSFILSVYVPFGVLFFSSIMKTISEKKMLHFKNNKKATVLLCGTTYILCIVLSLMFGYNTYMLKYKKQDLPQYKFDKYIAQTQNPTLLNYYCMDGGFYTVSDIVPNCKYFCVFAKPLAEAEEVQNEYVENARIDYIVTRNKELTDSQLVNYKLICSAEFEIERDVFATFYLYEKR